MSGFTGTDRFSIRRRLGSGGTGVVFEAFDDERQTLVALKVPHDAATRDISLFKQEFRALAEVSHPNLVGLYEVLSHGPEWFFTMERVEGLDFLEALCPGRQPPADYQPVRAALLQLAEGLRALHQIGRLHRDLKPGHVRIDPDGRVVLLDFGLGAERRARGGGAPGTQAYMAPERIGGLAATEAGDWYSVGAMLYQVLTGSLPFPGGTLSAQIDKMRGDPPAPGLLVPETPQDLSQLCLDLLARKPGSRPAGIQVLERLGAPAIVLPVPPPPPRPRTSRLLVGRKAELAALAGAFEASQQGKAVVVFVHGESGMGKSYLLRRCLRQLKREQPRAVVLAGRCSQEGSVPYKALGGLMDDLAGHLQRVPAAKAALLLPRDILCLARLFPVLHQVEAIAAASRAAAPSPDPQELRRRAFGALRELLMRLGARTPLVLAIEDLQWGDLDSAALLLNLLREPDPPSMLVLMTYRGREDEAAPVLKLLQSRLAEDALEVRRVPVERIPTAQAEELALALLGSGRPAAAPEAAWIAQESGGNPFLIGELSRYLRSGGAVSPGGAGEQTLDSYIRSRVADLPGPSRVILETLALAGHPVEWEVLLQACGLQRNESEALTPLRAGHLIRARGSRRPLLEPYHDRIRQSVLRDVPEDRARAIHLALAQAMEREPRADAQALSQHFQAAGEPVKAGRQALLAADEAVAALAFGRAADFYRRALQLDPPAGPECMALLLKLGDALASAGLGHEAAPVYLQALALAPPGADWRLRRRAAEEYFKCGHFDQAEAALAPVLASIGLRLARRPWRARLAESFCRLRIRARGYGFRERSEDRVPQAELDRMDICWVAAMGLGPVDHVRGGEFQARHTLLALAAGEPFRLVRALALETIYASSRGTRSLAATQRIRGLTMALAQRIGHPNPVSRALVAAGTAALRQGEWPQAVELLERAEVLLRDHCTGLDYELHLAQCLALQARLKLGSLKDMESRLAARIEAAQDKGDLLAITTLKTSISPHLHLAHDDPSRAMRELQGAIDEWSTAGFHLQHYHALVARVEILLYERVPDQALAILAGHWRALRRALLPKLQYARIQCLELRARSALALVLQGQEPRRRRGLLRSAARDIRGIEAEGVGYGNALALRLQALEALALGFPDQAGALLFQAGQAFQACGMALHAMVAQYRRGGLEGPSGAEQREVAEHWLRRQGIVDPQRFVAMHLPG